MYVSLILMLFQIFGVLLLIIIPVIFVGVTNYLKRKQLEAKLTQEDSAETLKRQKQLEEQRGLQRNSVRASTVRPGTASTPRPSTTTTSNSAYFYGSNSSHSSSSSDSGGSSDASCGGGGCD